MSQKEFKDLNDNDIFISNGSEYKKIPLVRVSCCKSYNAELVVDSNQRIFIQPSTQVEINDQL